MRIFIKHLIVAVTASLLLPTSAQTARRWQTTADLTEAMAAKPDVVFGPLVRSERITININSRQRYQTLLGLGSSLEPSTCSNLWSMGAGPRQEVIERLVNPIRGIGMNLMRICIGTPDFTGDAWYTYDDMPPSRTDPDLRFFSIDRDRAYILPVLKAAFAANKELLFFASPWSPPGWMKSTGTMIGGALLPEFYPAYAQYFVRFIQAYEAAGIPIYAVTVQNEPGVDRSLEKDPKWHYPSCRWTAEQERDFIRDHLGPAIVRAGLKTQIWCYDHNYTVIPSGDDPGLAYPRTILSDPEAWRYVDGVAFHGYAGKATAMSQFHDEFRGKPVHFTEGSVFGMEGAAELVDRLRNWACSYNAWVTVLDENGKPNNGPFPATHAIVRWDTAKQKPTYLLEYYLYGHFMKFAARGAQRIESHGGPPHLKQVAFRNPDGTIVLVVVNLLPETQRFEVRASNRGLQTAISPSSIMTLTWSTDPIP